MKKEKEAFNYKILVLNTDNARKSTSVYKFVKDSGGVETWEIEMDIESESLFGRQVFIQLPDAPTQGLNEIAVNQPFCRNVMNEIVKKLYLQNELLVLGDHGFRREGEVYADIIIGHKNYRQELTTSTPDLSKGLGWEVKNDLRDGTKRREGKGQLIKYARIYLTADRPLTRVFYGCLTDGSLWGFAKIQLCNEDGVLKMKFKQSPLYQWNEHTASLITGLISRYYDELIEKKMGDDNTYMNRKMSSITSESILASFIKEGVHIRLKSSIYVHVQVTSLLGTGRESIVFLAQVYDYGIKDAVLKIEVCKNTEISQVYREISVLCELSDLSCVPKILFEGHTAGGFPALLTDFVGQSLESLIPNNSNIDDFIIFRVIPDLLSCLQKVHASGYAHGDVAIRNVIERNARFYLIDYGLAIWLQLQLDPCQALIRDYIGLCQIIGIIKFKKKMSLLELTDILNGKLKRFVATIDNASRWGITDEEEWLKKLSTETCIFVTSFSK